MIKVQNVFNIGDPVYLVTDTEQVKRLVTGINIQQGGNLVYVVSYAEAVSLHYDFELSKERDVILATSS